jgi:predicted nucleic acid-binding protein
MINVLIDTNVLVYMYDLSEPKKRQRAVEVLQQVREAEAGALSAQVLSEFYNTVTRKLEPPLTAAQAEAQLQALAQVWPVFPVTSQVVFEAIRGVRAYQFSFWDAQIWAAARLNHVSVVMTEDFNPGAVIEGVRFVDPFADDFRLQDWGVGE